MPGMYKIGDYDIAGFSLGIVEKDSILPRIDSIEEGDLVIGLPSSGIHSNGFSLIHKIMSVKNLNFNDIAPFSANQKSYGKIIFIINYFVYFKLFLKIIFQVKNSLNLQEYMLVP